MLTPLFHRFESAKPYTMENFSQDVADILGARRALPFNVEGVIGWGLQNTYGFSPNSDTDRRKVAQFLETTLTKFEPRLAKIQVSIDVEHGLSFRLDAILYSEDGDEELALRLANPSGGGVLGAGVSRINES